MNRLAASGLTDRSNLTSMEYAAGMASRSGIAFQVPTSKFSVPFPYGTTLERLAAQYLGDPNRWHEIAVLNGLRHPFVDEVGLEQALLTNGRGNQVVVQDGSNLFVGQSVWISGNGVSRTQRRITRIDSLELGVAVEVDGDSDMDRYGTLNASMFHAYLPDTVNSQQSIFIPSDETADEEDFLLKSIPGIDEFDPYIQAGGVELLLTQDGDLAITPDGDCKLAVGLTALVQRLRLLIATPKGSLLHHPEWGFPVEVGQSTAEMSALDIQRGLQAIVSGDSAFTSVQAIVVQKLGPAIRVSMSVGVKNADRLIPVTIDLQK
jgi:hypothetical protein